MLENAARLWLQVGQNGVAFGQLPEAGIVLIMMNVWRFSRHAYFVISSGGSVCGKAL